MDHRQLALYFASSYPTDNNNSLVVVSIIDHRRQIQLFFFVVSCMMCAGCLICCCVAVKCTVCLSDGVCLSQTKILCPQLWILLAAVSISIASTSTLSTFLACRPRPWWPTALPTHGTTSRHQHRHHGRRRSNLPPSFFASWQWLRLPC